MLSEWAKVTTVVVTSVINLSLSLLRILRDNNISHIL